jgi:3-hydroxybutyryl-CoA dehydrogenase
MQLIIFANERQKQELLTKKINEDVEVVYLKEYAELLKYRNAEAILILDQELTPEELQQIQNSSIFLNSVSKTLGWLGMPKNVSRINGWMTCLKNDVWEIATSDKRIVRNVFDRLGWRYIFVADEPGLVSARIIAMIVNEAYFALGDLVSSKSEINIAMKLGTNYPYGPFEWSEKIGLKNIYSLLVALNQNSTRYNIAPALEKELAASNS